MNENAKVEKGYVVGYQLEPRSLEVYRSSNGKEWERVDELNGTYSNLSASDVVVYDRETVFIVGGDSKGGGFLLWTGDDGGNWQRTTFEKEILSVGVADGQVWLGAAGSVVYHCENIKDPNSVWQTFDLHQLQDAPKDLLVQGLACAGRDEVYVVGNSNGPMGGGIWYTSDRGGTWEELKPPPPSTSAPLNYIGVVFNGEHSIYFHGATGLLVKWDGYKWYYIQEPAGGSGHDVNGIFVVDDDDIWMACDWKVVRYNGEKTINIPCEREGNFMLGISVWGETVWACGSTGAGSPTDGILTMSERCGKEDSWQTVVRKQFMGISICATRVSGG